MTLTFDLRLDQGRICQIKEVGEQIGLDGVSVSDGWAEQHFLKNKRFKHSHRISDPAGWDNSSFFRPESRHETALRLHLLSQPVTLTPFISLLLFCGSGRAPVDPGASAVEAGHAGPLLGPSQNHIALPVPSRGDILRLCSLCVSLSETRSLSGPVTWSVCVVALAEGDSV